MNNSHFRNSDRPAYELPFLFKNLGDVDRRAPLTPDQRSIAEAAQAHAFNANEAIMRGVESIGRLLVVAGLNEEGLDGRHLCDIGELLTHLAVEAQFLQDTEADMIAILRPADIVDEEPMAKPAPANEEPTGPASAAGRKGEPK